MKLQSATKLFTILESRALLVVNIFLWPGSIFYALEVDELKVRLVNWLLSLGWLLLIASLLFSHGPWFFAEVKLCGFLPGCENHPDHLGNILFWGGAVPQILLLIVLSGHTVWRRICPLAFISQSTRHLNWQRRRRRPNGVLEVAKIDPNSFWGRHHVRWQWFFLFVGLCLRLLAVNSDPFLLAMLLLTTLLAAVLVGWLWGGKAWCQYFCPMGPVEAILVGHGLEERSLPIATAKKTLPQSVCRTVEKNANDSNVCVNCQIPCIDIDAERSYWYNQVSGKGFDFAWWSYPGLVLSFFLILQSLEPGDPLYISRAHWATDTRLETHILYNFHVIPHLLDLPRILAIPALLLLGAMGSFLVFFLLHHRFHLSQHRCRLVATFLALNSFFCFADPSLGVMGSIPMLTIRLLVLAFSSRLLISGWSRERGVYLHEKALLSLYRHALRHPSELTSIRLVPTWSRRRQMASLNVMVSEIAQQASQELRQRLYRLVFNDLTKEAKIDQSEAHQVIAKHCGLL